MTTIDEAVQRLVQAALGSPVVIGATPPMGGYAVMATGGAPLGTFRNGLRQDVSMTFVFNGKGYDQQALVTAMRNVHGQLTTIGAGLPQTEQWQIYAIETMTAPSLIDREENGAYIYGSALRVKYYFKGV